jgi:spore coat protein CotH
VKWVNEASDADFAARLADYVDVESFAAYAALQNLLLNFDDMAGPGKNYYLWYDLDAERFKVIGWDHNLALRGNAAAGPHDVISMGGGRFIGPGGQQPPAIQVPQGRVPAGGGRGGLGGNRLKERFLAAEAFKPLYEETYRTLYRKVYADRTAENALAAISATLGTVAGNDTATTTADTEQLRTLIQQRTAALARHEVISRS